MSEIATIKFGRTSFDFNMSDNLENFLETNKINSQKLIPTASSWYKQVLHEINISHKEEKKIKILFFLDMGEIKTKNEKYSFLSQSPLRFKDSQGNKKEEKIKFIAKIIE